MFYQFSFSPQVKRCAIITCKHGIHELSHELPNELKKTTKKLRILPDGKKPDHEGIKAPPQLTAKHGSRGSLQPPAIRHPHPG